MSRDRVPSSLWNLPCSREIHTSRNLLHISVHPRSTNRCKTRSGQHLQHPRSLREWPLACSCTFRFLAFQPGLRFLGLLIFNNREAVHDQELDGSCFLCWHYCDASTAKCVRPSLRCDLYHSRRWT